MSPTPDLEPVLEAIKKVEGEVKQYEQTIGAALSSLRTLVIQHYHAVQSRADHFARQIARIETELKLPPLPPEDPPRALADAAE